MVQCLTLSVVQLKGKHCQTLHCRNGVVHMSGCTEVRFANFLTGGFIAAIVVNPPERKLEKRTSNAPLCTVLIYILCLK